MQDPKYVINLVELQNINTSASGESVGQEILTMVNYPTKTVFTDGLSSFSGGSISVGSDLVLNGNISVGGTLTLTSTGAGSTSLTVLGPQGPSAVYDTLYNPPTTFVGNILNVSPFTTSVSGTPFSLTRSGLFYVQLVVGVATGSSFAANSYIAGSLIGDTSFSPSGGQQTLGGGGIAVPGAGTLTYTCGGVCAITAGLTYTYNITIGAGAVLGAGSSASVELYRMS
jgi:hypothetical protein